MSLGTDGTKAMHPGTVGSTEVEPPTLATELFCRKERISQARLRHPRKSKTHMPREAQKGDMCLGKGEEEQCQDMGLKQQAEPRSGDGGC